MTIWWLDTVFIIGEGDQEPLFLKKKIVNFFSEKWLLATYLKNKSNIGHHVTNSKLRPPKC